MIRFSATYFDGESTRAHPVEVAVDEGDTVHVHGLATAVSAPLSALRIAPRLGNTVRSLAFPGGARAESDAHDALDALLARAGTSRGLGFVHTLESQWRWALAAAALLAVVLAGGVRWGIPLAAREIALRIPDALAYDLGKSTFALFDRTLFQPTRLTPARQAALRDGFAGMAQSYPGLPLRLHFRRGIGPNALALPDGSVIVTDELCELSEHDDEIFAVLAHEIGHVHHRHGLRAALEGSSVALLVSAYFGDVAQISTLTAALPAAYAQAHYSREHELEADAFAFEHLVRAGIEPRHFVRILTALTGEHPQRAGGHVTYLESHPPTAERVRRFESLSRPSAAR